MNPEATPPSVAPLRQRAEEQLLRQPKSQSEFDALRLLHELQVHQVELLMQNEALQQSEAQAREALADLTELQASMEARIVERTAELAAARQAADAANRSKSSFLSNMSHELRTPMNGVLGMIDLSLLAATDARQVEWLGTARRCGVQLLAMINDILDLSKIEAGHMDLDLAAFELGSVLQLTSDLLAPQVSAAGLRFSLELPPALATRQLMGDSHRLQQILLNLAGNAVKFTNQGGVHLAVAVVEEAHDDALLRFEVTDTGIGIAPQDHVRIFASFEQADASVSRRYGGTGLGLAICKRLVALMGGEIGVRSALGAGSSFWFTARLGTRLPTSLPAAQAVDALAQLRSGFAGVRILLVEDNPVSQQVLRGLVVAAGLKLDVAADGAAALARARDVDYALILMDLHMPGLGGIETTARLRSMPGRERTPVIALTASVFDQDRQRCLEASMCQHLAKPVDPPLLYAALLRWLGRG